MKKTDILAGFIIGEACALIFLFISKFLELPVFVIKLSGFFPALLPVFSILAIYIFSLLGKKWPALFQWGKSFLSGVLNSFIDLGILNVLMLIFAISSGPIYSVFKSVSFIFATINSYFWNKLWAFEKKEMEKAGKEMLQFFIIAGIGFTIHLIVATVLVNVIGPQFGLTEKIWANVGAIAAMFFGFSWNFLGYKFIVFKK